MIEIENKLSVICKPWVEVGKNLVQQLLEPSNDFNLTNDEVDLIINLSDEELAISTLLLSTYSMQNESVVIDGMEIPYQKIWDCFVSATGINDIFYLMSELRTQTIDGILRLLIKKPQLIAHFAKIARGLTYFGLAVTVMQFTYCITQDAIPISNEFNDTSINHNECAYAVEFIIIP